MLKAKCQHAHFSSPSNKSVFLHLLFSCLSSCPPKTWWDLLLLDRPRTRWCSKGLKVLTGTISYLCLSGRELPLVLLKTSRPVVHVCLCGAQLTFGILAFQSAAHGTSCLPPVLNDAAFPILDKTFKPHAYVRSCVCVAVHMQRKEQENTHTHIL